MADQLSILKKGLLVRACAVLLLLAASPAFLYAGNTQQKTGPNATQARKAGAPVVFNGRILFTVQSTIHSLPADTRAKLIADRIHKLADAMSQNVAGITVAEGGETTEVISGDLTILTVNDADARAAGTSRAALASTYAEAIRTALKTQRDEYGIRRIVSGVLATAVSTLVFVILLYIMNRVFPRIYDKLYSWKGVYIRSIKFQNFEIMSAGRLAFVLVRTVKYLRIGLVALLLYFYVPLVLSFFPWTAGYSSVIFDAFMAPLRTVGLAFLSYLPKLVFLFVIVILTRYGLKLVLMVFTAVEKGALVMPNFHAEWALPTYKIVRFLILAFAAVVAFPYLPGSESPAFRGISVLLGILFSFGSAGAVSNIVAGVIIIYMRAFKIGDRVRISETIGDVVEKTLLVTRIRTIKNEDISIPNSMVLGSHIINYSTSAKDLGLILHTTVTIGYDAPWRKVHELLIAAAQSTEDILKDPAPFVLQTSLDDFYVSYEVNAYTNQPSRMASIYAALHGNIQDKFNEGGVEIMSPHYSSLRDGNKTTMPAEYLGKGYVPPGFTITGSGNISGISASSTHTKKKE